MRTPLFLPLVLMMTLAVSACDGDDGLTHPRSKPPTEPPTQPARNMKISLKLPDKTLTATLYDTPTARDFASMLPLTLTLEDYAKTEKVSDLTRKLMKDGAPAGADPSVGDIAYYAPWGNLALFYQDFRYSDGRPRNDLREVDHERNCSVRAERHPVRRPPGCHPPPCAT